MVFLFRRALRIVALALSVGLLAGAPAGAARGAVAAATSRAGWSWPVPAPHPIVTPYRPPAEVWSAGHRGIDIGALAGAVVIAPEAGTVHYAGIVAGRPVLSLEHADGLLSSFEPVVATVARGDHVERGQPIGVLDPGHCQPAACLHLGARLDGGYVSPLDYLGLPPRAVLLPTRPLP